MTTLLMKLCAMEDEHFQMAQPEGWVGVASLLANGADPNEQDENGNTAMHMVFSKGTPCLGIMDMLLQAGSVLDVPNKYGLTPLMVGLHWVEASDLMSFPKLVDAIFWLSRNNANWLMEDHQGVSALDITRKWINLHDNTHWQTEGRRQIKECAEAVVSKANLVQEIPQTHTRSIQRKI